MRNTLDVNAILRIIQEFAQKLYAIKMWHGHNLNTCTTAKKQVVGVG